MIQKQQVFAQEDTKIHSDKTETERIDSSVKPQQYFSDDQFINEQQLTSIVDQHIAAQPLNATKPMSKFTKLMLLSLLALVSVETALGLIEAFNTSQWLFGFYTVVMAIVITWAIKAALVEWRKLSLLKKVATQQQISERLSQSVQTGEADKFIHNMVKAYPNSQGKEQYLASASKDHNDAEKLALFDSLVLTERDELAKKIVGRFAAESAVLLAASPLAALDMAIILWRNQKMITDIANVYGIELGYWSRIKLIRTIIVNIIYAGSSEVLTDLGTQMMSMEMTGKLSVRIGQGLGGGLLTARLGYQAMRLCRPIKFTVNNRPKLRQVYQSLLSELKAFSQRNVNTLDKESIYKD
ncbi:TIGR01620 family protein [Shewanella intestini]|uniref:TIGR01620 family protein n=1 Tax=Shewanella intestini TaxID=2017544 RepID=A0ABS5I5Z3_9GAMM|nr:MULTISPECIES: TIGR01620 family protein [Shewanella]MBR9729258.1 TIGR01620 family protein [Shewanella intestini]MRG35403.1 TIGR01620 family protein [Shewanella sp. XMDDZSB0408]